MKSYPSGRMRRREFCGGIAASLLYGSKEARAKSNRGFTTPYKYGKLVLQSSGVPGEFDSISVDDPFVFSVNGQFYMTYVGFDGIGYQTGLASSTNLVDWKKEGCILRRDDKSTVIKYNVALTWIVRENGLYGPGALSKIGGQYLGTYTAYPGSGYEQGAGVIGLCRSADLRHWTIDPPCLLPHDGAAWEKGGLYKTCLVHDTIRASSIFTTTQRTEPRAPGTNKQAWRYLTIYEAGNGIAGTRSFGMDHLAARTPGSPAIPAFFGTGKCGASTTLVSMITAWRGIYSRRAKIRYTRLSPIKSC